MFIYTYYLSLGYLPTNSRIIFKRVLAEDACSGLVEKFKRPVTSLVGRGVATPRIFGQTGAFKLLTFQLAKNLASVSKGVEPSWRFSTPRKFAKTQNASSGVS
ncbi:hypothetical protein AVEN_184215-1 [Araneus ventricosus]|uniref:Uncharacterized protein n=1 Tax=Araneus ventricosus TaxID=182803 RepID=A0A4Y2M2E5_ARAVE|nr:hypothetical protein AVEN_184215-1 [Araneus ventricosus]